MRGILLTKFRLFIRKPWLFITMTAVCMMFAFFIGKVSDSQVEIPVFSELPQESFSELLNQLNESEVFVFKSMSESDIQNAVHEGKVEAGLHVWDGDFRLIITSESANVSVIKRYVQTIFTEVMQKASVLESVELEADKEIVEEVWDYALEKPIFTTQLENFKNEKARIIDMQLQGIFGFSLFFVIYTISFNVSHILEEKQDRIWDRMIVSSVKKWEVYVGNLLYAFIMGYVQVILVFSTFHFGAGVNFHGGFGKTLVVLIPYVLAIVALCMLVAGISKSIGHFNALIPLLSVSLAMLGGAYWPIEIISSKFMLILGKISPLMYGMEALKGATLYSYDYSELLQPISILLLMAVIMMGLGINLMEKRNT